MIKIIIDYECYQNDYQNNIEKFSVIREFDHPDDLTDETVQKSISKITDTKNQYNLIRRIQLIRNVDICNTPKNKN